MKNGIHMGRKLATGSSTLCISTRGVFMLVLLSLLLLRLLLLLLREMIVRGRFIKIVAKHDDMSTIATGNK